MTQPVSLLTEDTTNTSPGVRVRVGVRVWVRVMVRVRVRVRPLATRQKTGYPALYTDIFLHFWVMRAVRAHDIDNDPPALLVLLDQRL